ncbi:MAG: PrgI family protein [bacterium]|nr:PrgI family protein [bacterium]
MQFQVPQFIEVEDKIFGPLTFKQFIYIGGGLGASYILFRILPIYLAAPLIAVVGGLAAGLAFFQFNGRPFIVGLENGFYFLLRSKLYLWNNTRKKKAAAPAPLTFVQGAGEVYVPKLSESRLHELSWSLDIKERIAAGVSDEDERERVHTRENIVAPIRTAREAMSSFSEQHA